MKTDDINVRVLRVALVPALIIALLLSLYFARQRLIDLERVLNDRASAIARQLAPAAEFGVYSGNREVLDQLVAAVSAETGVTAVVIRDRSGELLSSSYGAELLPEDDAGSSEPRQGETADGRTLVSSAPIVQSRAELEEFFEYSHSSTPAADAAPKLLGRVYVVMSRTVITEQRKRLFLETLLITLLILIANVFIAVRMSRKVSRPIALLTDAVQKIARGDLATRVTPASDGVVRALEDGVNVMAQTLESSRTDLERRIASATTEVERRREEAERANRAKSRFLAAASHDLRQPLHALGLFVAGLQAKPLQPDAQGIAQQIDRSVVAMQDLLEALLDISRLDSGGVQAAIEDFPVQRLLSAMEAHFASSARVRSLRLRIVPSRLYIRSDPVLLERVLLNLISNALRYTERGTVLLGCRRHDTAISLEVWDTGVGIAKTEQQRIFDEFYRIPGGEPRGNEAPGLGLGLAIVERFARLLDHRISVRSTLGRGSAFTIQVPRAPNSSRTLPVRDEVMPPRDASGLAGLSILVIDDDAAARSAAITLFESWRCEVYAANSGADAQALLSGLNACMPQLIVCDYRLSEQETGVEVLNRLFDGIIARVPAILVSADLSTDVIDVARANGYPLLHKPLRPAKLRSLVVHLMLQTDEQ